MRHVSSVNQQPRRSFRFLLQYFKWAAASTVICLATSAAAFQSSPAGTAKRPAGAHKTQPSVPQKTSPQEKPWIQELDKYPGLLPELAHLQAKLQQELKFPAMRGPSRLLPLLPESTTAYVALPNYGEALNQTLQIFHQELQESAVLRDWWQRVDLGMNDLAASGSAAKTEPKAKNDEIVFSMTIKDPEKSGLIMAEIKKPGLQAFLQQLGKDFPGNPGHALRIFDPQQLTAANNEPANHEPIVLVRPDLMVVGFDLSTLRAFNAHLDAGGGRFASTPFGQRLAQSYQGGAGVLVAADLQQLLTLMPKGTLRDQPLFQQSGFADLKYLIWEHRDADGQTASQGELSFTGPRHGIASWLAPAAPLGSLDFVSPRASMVEAFVLKNPAQIFDEVREIATSGKPGAFANLDQMEQGLQLRLKEDLLGKLTGEVAVEVDGTMQPTPEQPIPSFKLILGVKDAEGLQQTLSRLQATTGVQAKPHEEGGLTFYSFLIPSGQKPVEVGYAFRNGYMIIASSPELLIEADRIHQTGKSLAKSRAFLESLPAGRSADASAMFYEDLGAVMEPMLKQMPPELAAFLPQLTGSKAIVMVAYGDESAFRWASTSSRFDAGLVMVTAAIAIPNIIKSKNVGNVDDKVSVPHRTEKSAPRPARR